MYVNDPVADMLTRIRNANMIYAESVHAYSRTRATSRTSG